MSNIPSDWRYVKLDEVATRSSGHTPDKKIKEYWGGEIKWISLKDTKKLDNGYIYSTEDYTTSEGIRNSSAVLLPRGTIVISRDATVGKVGIMSESMATSQHFINYTCSDKINNIFLYHYLQSIKSEFQKVASGSTIKTIGLGFFKKLSVILPPLKEQEKIAEILSAWDLAIEKQEQLIEKKKEFKKGLMQRLFSGEVRFKEFKEEWFKSPISKIAKIGIGKTPDRKNNNYWGTGHKWLSIGDMRSKNILNTKEEITQLAIEECNMKIVPKGTLVMSFKLTLGKVAILDEDMYTNEAICNFNVNKKIINRDYLYYYLDFIDVSKFGSRATKGITLNQETLSGIIIKYPCLEEQDKIAETLISIDKEIELLEQELEALKLQKKGLMQRLLTGEVRVKV